MVEFKIIKSGEIKQAANIREEEGKMYVKFTEEGKEYAYSKQNIEVLSDKEKLPFIVYEFERVCYKCGEKTKILTYIVFDDDSNESLVYPWDKDRLLSNQDIRAHLLDPSIEYYGFNVLGRIEEFDKIMLEKYPNIIKLNHSYTQNREYAMNHCQNCGIKQGEYYIYRELNERILKMEKIKIKD